MKLDPLKLITDLKLSQLHWNKCILLGGGDRNLKLWIIKIDGTVSLNELKTESHPCWAPARRSTCVCRVVVSSCSRHFSCVSILRRHICIESCRYGHGGGNLKSEHAAQKFLQDLLVQCTYCTTIWNSLIISWLLACSRHQLCKLQWSTVVTMITNMWPSSELAIFCEV